MSAYNDLKQELARTGVISQEFKALIMAYAGVIAEEAARAARAEAARPDSD